MFLDCSLQLQCLNSWLPDLLLINVKQRLLTIALNSISIIKSLPAPTGKVREFHVVWKLITM